MADDANAAAAATEQKPDENAPVEDKPEDAAGDTETAKQDGEAAPVLVAPTENPFGVDDFEHILQMEASEGADNGWEPAKKTAGAEVFKKKDKNSEINMVKSFLTLTGIPLDKAVEFITKYDGERKKWDKDNVIEVLDEKSDFSIIYWIFKMPAACTDRDFVMASTTRADEDNKRHIILYKDCVHPDKPPNSTFIRGDTMVNGLIIRPDDKDAESSKVTLIQQFNMKGWIPKFLLNRLTLARALGLREQMLEYWKELNKPAPKENGPTENKEEKKEGEETKEEAESKPEGGEEEKKEE
ncbi:uncharacterized protein LOC144434010 [Glandiceps talaboti]